ncbi:MAG: 3,4-dihydroxy-2-butanone-4-phosphate synthase [Chloroflexi bacterium]|nr:3,4-dihydroxy-2-butanone-4-phosphate synthase [Chloroflexota bacterium]
MPFVEVPEAIADFRAGKFMIVVDDDDRENEGDLAIAAEHVTPEAINFLAAQARGLICMPIVGKRLDELQIPLMVERRDSNAAAFTVSVDSKLHATTGISAQDRASTVKALLDPATRPADLVMPGHIFPLRYREGGVLCRAGHTEASVDLAKLAGLYPAAVICECLRRDGSMARLPDLTLFANRFQIGIVSVAQIVAYRSRQPVAVAPEVHAVPALRLGDLVTYNYRG